MICNNCNQENENDAKFCRFCGTPLNGEEQANSSAQPEFQNPPPYNPAQNQAPPPNFNGQQPYGQPYPGSMPPPPYGQQPPAPQINQNSYLIWAILTTLFCCLPFGIASIVYASRINGFLMSGNFMMAQESAKKSKTFSIVAACVGGGLYLLYFIFIVVIGMSAAY